jgi:hypothetical protein
MADLRRLSGTIQAAIEGDAGKRHNIHEFLTIG